MTKEELLKTVEDVGFDCAIAIATEAEIQANAACGQMSLIHDKDSND
jgi:hypothetical protein